MGIPRLPSHPLPKLTAALPGHGGAELHLFPLPCVATTYSPQLLLLGTTEENNLMCQFPSLCSWRRADAAHLCTLPLLDLTFPTGCLSLPMKKPRLGQVLTSFLVGCRTEIKAQVKSLPHGALSTFPFISHMPVPRLWDMALLFSWEHGFAFQSRLINLSPTAETNKGI